MCLEAIKQDPFNMVYVNQQTDKLCLTAIILDINVFPWIRVPTEEMCRLVVDIDGRMLDHIYIDNQTHDVCVAAITQTNKAYQHVRCPTPELTALHKMLWEV